jgi:hypothetical protein
MPVLVGRACLLWKIVWCTAKMVRIALPVVVSAISALSSQLSLDGMMENTSTSGGNSLLI